MTERGSFLEFSEHAYITPQANGLWQVNFSIFSGSKICYIIDCSGDTTLDIKRDAFNYVQGVLFKVEDSSRAFVRDITVHVTQN